MTVESLGIDHFSNVHFSLAFTLCHVIELFQNKIVGVKDHPRGRNKLLPFHEHVSWLC
jgi:hypothetical protein